MSSSQSSLWDYRDNFEFDVPLDPDDSRYVELAEARGSYSQREILQELGFNLEKKALFYTPKRKYLLFGGHRGCGKSTELRRLAACLQGPDAYFVVFVDALEVLDINNLNYSDILLAQAKVLVERLIEDGITVDPVYLTRLENWFAERIESREHTRALGAEIRAGAKASGGLPLIASLFASLTTSVRDNTSVKEELRLVVRDSFSQFSQAFNALLAHVNAQLQQQQRARAILFVVDGTDRLQGDEANAFFIQDIHQLRQVESNFIYCAPIDLLLEQGYASQSFDAIFRLPMVKLTDKGGQNRHDIAWFKMQQFLTRRLPQQFFADTAVMDRLIHASGGHPRDLLRLVGLCFQMLVGEQIEDATVSAAIHKLAQEYRRLIEPRDYQLLVEIDRADSSYTPNSPETRRLLYFLLLLEYNSFWWQSHPVIRELPGYREWAAKAADEA